MENREGEHCNFEKQIEGSQEKYLFSNPKNGQDDSKKILDQWAKKIQSNS